jgi:hypothetical protein
VPFETSPVELCRMHKESCKKDTNITSSVARWL